MQFAAQNGAVKVVHNTAMERIMTLRRKARAIDTSVTYVDNKKSRA